MQHPPLMVVVGSVFSVLLIVLITSSSLIHRAHAIPKRRVYTCPSPNEPPAPIGETSIRLRVTRQDELCVLAVIQKNGDTNVTSFVPAGRSYEGFDWESVAGRFRQVQFRCNDTRQEEEDDDEAAERSCTVDLPSLQNQRRKASDEAQYHLYGLARPHPIIPAQTVSRFLEQATFGPTKSLLQSWKYQPSLESTFASWIKEQIHSTPATFHRVTFRTSTIPQYARKNKLGIPMNPCDVHSRWRKHAFTSQDGELQKEVEVRPIHATNPNDNHNDNHTQTQTYHPYNRNVINMTDNGGPYLLLIDNLPRTQIDKLTVSRYGQLPPGKYPLCHFMHDGVGQRMHLRVKGECQRVVRGNPPIVFVHEEGMPEETSQVLDLDLQKGVDLEVVNWDWTEGSEVILQTRDNQPLKDPVCDAVPLGGSRRFIYARQTTTTSNTNNNNNNNNNPQAATPTTTTTTQWYAFDPRVKLRQNTLSNPLPDGGGQLVTLAETMCANAPRTFLNSNTCQLSTEATACGPHILHDAPIFLNDEALRDLYVLTGRFVYAIANLRAEGNDSGTSDGEGARSFCGPGMVRWRRISYTSDDACQTSIQHPTTVQTLTTLLQSAEQTNKNRFMKDIYMLHQPQEACQLTNPSLEMGTKLLVGRNCYEHVHQDYLNVYDFTVWAQPYREGRGKGHPGNEGYDVRNETNPIKQIALDHFVGSGSGNSEDGTTSTNDSYSNSTAAGGAGTSSSDEDRVRFKLKFPHPMSYWESSKANIDGKGGRSIGRYGDTILFSDLPDELRTEEVAEHFGAIETTSSKVKSESKTTTGGSSKSKSSKQYGKGILVCGSPGEVANVHHVTPDMNTDTHKEKDKDDDDATTTTTSQSLFTTTEFDAYLHKAVDSTRQNNLQKKTLWLTNAMYAPDQLRQRVAHALSYIFSITVSQIHHSTHETESYTTYFDIFVRHAFGNYRDILREVSYSPMMGEMLSYLDSKSTESVFSSTGVPDVFPDENFAREIMQLFTVGTYKLHPDGTPRMDEDGNFLSTYTNDDVMDGARAWTGFARQMVRGNVENTKLNRVDPMQLHRTWRDKFPKMLLGGYVGDGFPLCADMPEKAFLRVGAKYRLLGSHAAPELQYDDPDWALAKDSKRVVLHRYNSSLYSVLCNQNDDPEEDEEEEGRGSKCNFRNEVILTSNLPCHGVECEIDTVRVVQVNRDTFYEYVRQPCVEMSFFEEGRKIKTGRWGDDVMCANPLLPAATESCCLKGTNRATRACAYFGERMTYQKASDRCKEQSLRTCDWRVFKWSDCGQCCKGHVGHHWTPSSCSVMAKVSKKGLVAIVHDAPEYNGDPIAPDNIRHVVNRDSQYWFRVDWLSGENAPDLVTNCTDHHGGQALRDGTCLFNVTIVEEPVVKTTPTPEEFQELLSECNIGAWNPAVFDQGAYASLEAPRSGGDDLIVVWGRVDGSPYDVNTIFQVTRHGETQFLRNVRLKVQIDSKATTESEPYAFRNPPHFINFLDPEIRDVQYETEAVLDRYFYHDNMAPFVAVRLTQRFGISNGSPRYVGTVAEAFRSGRYLWKDTSGETGDVTFGSGRYGDMEATIAAILLDREARSPILDADPSFGSIREPLIKVVHFMRAMELKTNPRFLLDAMEEKMGQMQYESDSVFSWFLYDYSPHGPLSSASLVSPEATLLITPYVMGLLSGFLSMVKYGTSYCDQGFGRRTHNHCSRIREGDFWASGGNLTFVPESSEADAVLDDLSLLLTAGRLSEKSRAVVKSAYEASLRSSDGDNSDDDDDEVSEETKAAALRVALQVMVATPEFHTTNLVDFTDEPRATQKREAPSEEQPYKAIVYFFMSGGCDSFNVLVPHEDCPLYQKYKRKRGGAIAMQSDELIPIDATGSGQPCDSFGVHKKLSFVQELYKNESALFFANTGMLFEPVTVDDYERKTKSELFAHNVQRKMVKETDPFQAYAGTGVLGRVSDMLSKKGLKTSCVALSDGTEALEGEEGKGPEPQIVSSKGFRAFDPTPSSKEVLPSIKNVNNATSFHSGLASETFSRAVHRALDETEVFIEALKDVPPPKRFPETKLGEQLRTVAHLIKARHNRVVDRDLFYVSTGNWDTHSNVKERLAYQLEEVNDALKAFKEEMEAQGLWENVVFFATSEFGRTMTPNSSGGSDHAWAGNYFMAGGGVQGGKILGQYPEDYDSLDIGRGRLLPTTSFEQCLNGVAEWVGVDPGDMDNVLPNRNNFDNLFSSTDLFAQKD